MKTIEFLCQTVGLQETESGELTQKLFWDPISVDVDELSYEEKELLLMLSSVDFKEKKIYLYEIKNTESDQFSEITRPPSPVNVRWNKKDLTLLLLNAVLVGNSPVSVRGDKKDLLLFLHDKMQSLVPTPLERLKFEKMKILDAIKLSSILTKRKATVEATLDENGETVLKFIKDMKSKPSDPDVITLDGVYNERIISEKYREFIIKANEIESINIILKNGALEKYREECTEKLKCIRSGWIINFGSPLLILMSTLLPFMNKTIHKMFLKQRRKIYQG